MVLSLDQLDFDKKSKSKDFSHSDLNVDIVSNIQNSEFFLLAFQGKENPFENTSSSQFDFSLLLKIKTGDCLVLAHSCWDPYEKLCKLNKDMNQTEDSLFNKFPLHNPATLSKYVVFQRDGQLQFGQYM